MKYPLSIITLIGFLTACGGGGGGESTVGASSSPEVSDGDVVSSGSSTSPSASSDNVPSTTSTSLGMMTDTSVLEANIPPTVTSSATAMTNTIVPDTFSYNPVVTKNVLVDITSYNTSRAFISIYGAFTQNSDGSYTADYNSRIKAATMENGTISLDYLIADSQYYMLAEVFFYDGSMPIQTRITNEQTSWVW
ncbi:hypothetical protein [Enterovibrio sp. 27052020O]|uniref:hypothetical protein n=1 Tax=Enterovibrio sp. 27052020O TaxID=3241166 RepID=UPI00388D9343